MLLRHTLVAHTSAITPLISHVTLLRCFDAADSMPLMLPCCQRQRLRYAITVFAMMPLRHACMLRLLMPQLRCLPLRYATMISRYFHVDCRLPAAAADDFRRRCFCHEGI